MSLNVVAMRMHLAKLLLSSVQFSLVSQSCPTLCDPMNHSTPGLPVDQIDRGPQQLHWPPEMNCCIFVEASV